MCEHFFSHEGCIYSHSKTTLQLERQRFFFSKQGSWSYSSVVVVHREVAHQPRVRVVLVGRQDLPNGRQVEHVPLRGGPHPLVSLVNNDGVLRERFHHVEMFNRCCVAEKNKTWSRYDGENQAVATRSKLPGLTLPVESHGRVPEVVAHLVPRHSLHRVSGFERIQHNAILLHFSPVHLLHNAEGQGG